jgi:hypothetical protein
MQMPYEFLSQLHDMYFFFFCCLLQLKEYIGRLHGMDQLRIGHVDMDLSLHRRCVIYWVCVSRLPLSSKLQHSMALKPKLITFRLKPESAEINYSLRIRKRGRPGAEPLCGKRRRRPAGTIFWTRLPMSYVRRPSARLPRPSTCLDRFHSSRLPRVPPGPSHPSGLLASLISRDSPSTARSPRVQVRRP